MLIATLLIATQSHKGKTLTMTGKELIKKMQAAVRAASPVTGTIETRDPSVKQVIVGTFKVMYPHRLFLSSPMGGPENMETHWTGTTFYWYTPSKKRYLKMPGPNFMMPPELFLLAFERSFSDEDIYSDIGKVQRQKFDGQEVYVVDAITPESAGPSYDTFYIDPKSLLPLGFDQTLDEPGSKTRDYSHTTYRNVVTHAPLTFKDFDWKPPKDAKPMDIPGKGSEA